jgi:hypothetical protein
MRFLELEGLNSFSILLVKVNQQNASQLVVDIFLDWRLLS